jgi:hypothetical protein
LTQEQIADLSSALTEAARNDGTVHPVVPTQVCESENELIFFFKPEVFGPAVNSAEIMNFALSLFVAHGVTISGAYVFPGPELAKLKTMDAHYGFINAMSRGASEELSPRDAEAIRLQLESDSDTGILGGHEILRQFPLFTPLSLDQLWATKPSVKIRSGMYVQKYDVLSQPIIIVNGFHPYQLEHFTAHGRVLVVLLLHSDLPWRFLRTRILGDTFPQKALLNTIRRHLFDNSSQYGLPPVSIAANCVHLSAGPFEAAFEFHNFFGSLPEAVRPATESNVSRTLRTLGIPVEKVLLNPSVTINETAISLFDISEEIDTTGAVALLKNVYFPSSTD